MHETLPAYPVHSLREWCVDVLRPNYLHYPETYRSLHLGSRIHGTPLSTGFKADVGLTARGFIRGMLRHSTNAERARDAGLKMHTRCGYEVPGVVLLQAYLYAHSLLRGVTFQVLLLSSCALSPNDVGNIFESLVVE
jgi:hypothetical protein